MTAAAVPADDWTPAPTDEPRVLRLVEAPEVWRKFTRFGRPFELAVC